MTGDRILEIMRESHRSVLQTHGIDPATLPVDELARNAAAILHAELQAEEVSEAIERETWADTWSPAP